MPQWWHEKSRGCLRLGRYASLSWRERPGDVTGWSAFSALGGLFFARFEIFGVSDINCWCSCGVSWVPSSGALALLLRDREWSSASLVMLLMLSRVGSSRWSWAPSCNGPRGAVLSSSLTLGVKAGKGVRWYPKAEVADTVRVTGWWALLNFTPGCWRAELSDAVRVTGGWPRLALTSDCRRAELADAVRERGGWTLLKLTSDGRRAVLSDAVRERGGWSLLKLISGGRRAELADAVRERGWWTFLYPDSDCWEKFGVNFGYTTGISGGGAPIGRPSLLPLLSPRNIFLVRS